MTPLEMVKKSNLVQSAYNYITGICGEIKNPLLRDRVLQAIHNPAPTFMEEYTTSNARRMLWQKKRGW